METFYRLHTYPLSYDVGSNISGDLDILASTHLLTESQFGLQYKKWLRHFSTNTPTNWAWSGLQYKWWWRHFIAYTHTHWAMIWVPILVVMETCYRLHTYTLSYALGSNKSADWDILPPTHQPTEFRSGFQYKWTLTHFIVHTPTQWATILVTILVMIKTF